MFCLPVWQVSKEETEHFEQMDWNLRWDLSYPGQQLAAHSDPKQILFGNLVIKWFNSNLTVSKMKTLNRYKQQNFNL